MYGDLIVKVTVKPNNKFKREGNDVISNLTLSLADVIFILFRQFLALKLQSKLFTGKRRQ